MPLNTLLVMVLSAVSLFVLMVLLADMDFSWHGFVRVDIKIFDEIFDKISSSCLTRSRRSAHYCT